MSAIHENVLAVLLLDACRRTAQVVRPAPFGDERREQAAAAAAHILAIMCAGATEADARRRAHDQTGTPQGDYSVECILRVVADECGVGLAVKVPEVRGDDIAVDSTGWGVVVTCAGRGWRIVNVVGSPRAVLDPRHVTARLGAQGVERIGGAQADWYGPGLFATYEVFGVPARSLLLDKRGDKA